MTVVTVTRETFLEYTGVDLTLEPLIKPSIDVIRTPFHWPYLDTDHSRLRQLSPRLWHRLRTSVDQLSFPERVYGPWRTTLEQAVVDVHRRKPVDLVIATANPATSWAAAEIMHTECGVPYVLDQRDAWTLDVFTGKEIHNEDSAASRYERRLFRHATNIWFVNEAITAWHQRRYPESAMKMFSVPNGWDETNDPHVLTTGQHDGRVVFGYLGTITRKVPVAQTVEGWIQAGWRSETLRESQLHFRGHLGFYTAEDPVLSRVMSRAQAAGVTWGGPLAKSKLHDFYGQCDALVLALGSGRFVTSGKVYEYMATGLPIISVHEPRNAASDVLKNYPWWIPTESLSAHHIAEAFIRASALAPLSDAERMRGRDYALQFRRDYIMSKHVHHLRDMVAISAAKSSYLVSSTNDERTAASR